MFCASLRQAEPALLRTLRAADAMVVTVLAAGGTKPAGASAGGDDEAWDVAELAALDVPILQGLCLTSSRADWAADDAGLSPLDVATQVAVPEFDGRLITVPFSFKEFDADGLSVYVPDPERAARVAGIAVRHARLRRIPNADKRIVLMLSAYPTKHARIGNAVGLDTPASAVALIRAMAAAGYSVQDKDGAGFPGVAEQDGNALIHALIEAGGQDPDWLTEEKLAGNPVRISAATYARWFDTLPDDFRKGVEAHWGPAPGELYVDGTDIVVAALRCGNVVLIVQPPRGFGENPVAIYHDPDLPPSHHYLGAYRWLAAPQSEGGFAADAIVHLGKHGNLEWLPGKTLGMSASCGTDAALGDLPLVYPFLVNDPGEGTQAKRRAHATLVDHLIPPMARAETYGDIARLEQLLDEHANVAALDPAKLPAIRQQIWTLMQAAKLDHDLGLEERPHEAEFDDFLLHVDGWLCEIKDVQIRDGLHILGAAPAGDARVDLVLAILRARQMWGGEQSLPGLREALGLPDDAPKARVDEVEALAHALVAGMEAAGWEPGAAPAVVAEVCRTGELRPANVATRAGSPASRHLYQPELHVSAASHASGVDVERVLRFAAEEVVPRLDATVQEIPRVLHALDGGFIPAGPSGSPLRGLVNVLPTGRNFYSVDPKAVPSRLAWETGQAMAESLVERYRRDHDGAYPRSVGLSVWGTSAMRTSGDDIAEVFALLGVRPVWDEMSRRVARLEVIDLAELGRPRIDVTVRISGFFRDAFPHVLALLDDAVQMVAALDEPPEPQLRARPLRAGRAPDKDLRLQARHLRRRPAAARRLPELARRRRPRRGLHHLGRLRLRPRAGRRPRPRRDGGRLPAHRRRGQEHRHPRARHRRLRRLLPVPRRHDRDGPRAHRQRAGRLRRRLHAPRGRPHPHPARGDVARVPRPRGQPALDGGHAPARVQGRVRDGRDRRLPLRLGRHHGRHRGLAVREAHRELRSRPGEPRVPRRRQPVGPARHGRAAAGGRRPRPVGGAGAGDPRRPAPGVPRDRGRPGGRVTRELYVIGIGAGNPEHLTLQAVAAMNRVDVFFTIDKGAVDGGATADLAALRAELLARHVTRPHRVVAAPEVPRDREPTPPRTSTPRRTSIWQRAGSSAAACSTRR